MNQEFYSLVVLPLLIFIARICDVSLGTVRIIFVSKGFKNIAPLIGFMEILIWIIAITRIMQNLDNWICYIAYAAGFATGNYVGMLIDEKLAIGYEMVRVITKKEATELVSTLREKGYGTTVVDAKGSEGDVAVVYIIIKRKQLEKVIRAIRKYNSKAFYTVEDIRFVNRDLDILPVASDIKKKKFFNRMIPVPRK